MARWSRNDKTRGISITLRASTLEAIDSFIELSEDPINRSALIEKAVLEYFSSRTKTKEAV